MIQLLNPDRFDRVKNLNKRLLDEKEDRFLGHTASFLRSIGESIVSNPHTVTATKRCAPIGRFSKF